MLLSVIIPAYNCSNTLSNAVKSILQADNKEIEIVIVDDGSTDNTPAVGKQLSDIHDNVLLITQQNSGAHNARLKGVSVAHGEYIMFCDADDTVDPQNLIKMMDVVSRNDFDIVVGCSRDFSSDGKLEYIQYNKIHGEMSSEKFIQGILLSKIIIGPACKCIKRNLFEMADSQLSREIVFNEDVFMNVSVGLKSRKNLVLKDTIVYNHLIDNPDSITHTRTQSEEAWGQLFGCINRILPSGSQAISRAFNTYIFDRLRSNYFNKGKKPDNIYCFIDHIHDVKPLSYKDKITMWLLKYPVCMPLYCRLRVLRRWIGK